MDSTMGFDFARCRGDYNMMHLSVVSANGIAVKPFEFRNDFAEILKESHL